MNRYVLDAVPVVIFTTALWGRAADKPQRSEVIRSHVFPRGELDPHNWGLISCISCLKGCQFNLDLHYQGSQTLISWTSTVTLRILEVTEGCQLFDLPSKDIKFFKKSFFTIISQKRKYFINSKVIGKMISDRIQASPLLIFFNRVWYEMQDRMQWKSTSPLLAFCVVPLN